MKVFSDACWNCYVASYRQRWNMKIKLCRYALVLCCIMLHHHAFVPACAPKFKEVRWFITHTWRMYRRKWWSQAIVFVYFTQLAKVLVYSTFYCLLISFIYWYPTILLCTYMIVWSWVLISSWITVQVATTYTDCLLASCASIHFSETWHQVLELTVYM